MMAGVSTMYAPSSYPVQDSLRLWNFAGMWNYLSGDKGSPESRVGSKPLADDLATPTTPSHAPISPPTAPHPTHHAADPAPPIGEDGEVLNGASVSCTVCHKKFANVHRLQRHMISHNESDVLRRFKCDECGKAFKFKHHLKEHKRIHSGEKPFECDHCGKRFSHSGSYSSHMSSKKCQLGRARGNVTFVNRASPQYSPVGMKRPPPGAGYLPKLPKGESPTPSDLGYSSPTRPISQDALLMSPPSLVSPGGLGAGIHRGFSPSLPQSIPQGLPYHPFNSLILAAQLQPQYTLLSLLSKNENRERKADQPLKEEEEEDREPGQLVIKEDPREDFEDDKKDVFKHRAESPRGFPYLRHVLDKVNSSVTKMKFEEAVSQASTNSLLRAPDDLRCHLCGACFSNGLEALQHSRFHCPRLADVTSAQESYKGQLIEGLAARLYKEAGNRQTTHDLSLGRSGYLQPASQFQHPLREPHREDDSVSEYDYSHIVDDEETTSDGKKVRVRSHIREDQLAIFRAHYSLNPRPKKDELQIIADKVDFPVRVVQVWFQNARARDRREGRCLTPNSMSPFLPPPTMPVHSYSPPASGALSSPPQGLKTSASLSSTTKSFMNSYYPSLLSSHQTAQYTNNNEEFSSKISDNNDTAEEDYDDPKPLDLSTRKSSIAHSPKPLSIVSDSDNDSTSLAISYKSESRTPTPTTTPTPFNNNVSESKEALGAIPGMGGDHQSKLAQILSGAKLRLHSPYAAESFDYGEKRPREEEGSGDEMRKRRRDEEGGIFQCDQCDKSFNKQSSLARHKYEHSGMRPYKCELCPKAFKHKHHLTEHSRLHTGEKPYQCQKCHKRFSHSGSYSQHMNHRFSYCKPISGLQQQGDPFTGRLSNVSTPASSPGEDVTSVSRSDSPPGGTPFTHGAVLAHSPPLDCVRNREDGEDECDNDLPLPSEEVHSREEDAQDDGDTTLDEDAPSQLIINEAVENST